jgi:hypothetical protein
VVSAGCFGWRVPEKFLLVLWCIPHTEKMMTSKEITGNAHM